MVLGQSAFAYKKNIQKKSIKKKEDLAVYKGLDNHEVYQIQASGTPDFYFARFIINKLTGS